MRRPAAIATLMIVAVSGLAFAGPASGSNAQACAIPDEAPLRVGSPLTDEGHFAYQDWMANPTAQRAVGSIGSAVEESFGPATKENHTRQLSSGYIGTAFDHYSQRAVVVVDPERVDMGQLTGRFAAAGGGAFTVEVRGGCHTAAELLDADSVISGRAWHPLAAQANFGGFLAAEDSTYHLTFGEGDRVAAAALKERLGDLVKIDYGTPALRSRANDGEPHWGGAAIGAGRNNNSCTSGFKVRLPNGAYGMVTAGHCFNNGQAVYSGSEYFGGAGNKYNYPSYDMMWVASWVETYAPTLYTDPERSWRDVAQAVNASVGITICASGFRTKAVCGITVRNIAARWCIPGEPVCRYYLLYAEKPGHLVGQGGDSGAPLYTRPTASTARVRGIEIGGTRRDNLYGENWSAIANHLGVTASTI